MAWLGFVIYFLLFAWLLTRMGFITRSHISRKLLVALFALKIAAGVVYFQFNSLPAYKHRSDTWKFYNRSLPETDKLLSKPAVFFKDLLPVGGEGTGGLFDDRNSYWNDMKDLSMVKAMAVCNVFSGRHYYTNIIFFNFVFFLGLIALYRLLAALFSVRPGWLIIAVFLIPSFLFWCSGIHKDGLIFTALAFIFYFFHKILAQRRVALATLAIVISLAVIFLLRAYLVFVLLPCLVLTALIHFLPRYRGIVLLLCFAVGILFFFGARHIHPVLDFPRYIAEKQQQFKALEGSSVVHTNDLEPRFTSFLENLPAAVDMGFFRPHPGEKGLMSIAAAVETILFWIVVIICAVVALRRRPWPAMVTALIGFSLLTLLVIGYTVNFSGAVVRYRSLVMPFLLSPLVAMALSKVNMIKNNI